ncbi:MAG: hypothetical protein ABI162_09235 [Luteolibacter sp.]
MPEGSCEAPTPEDGRFVPDGGFLDGVLDGDDGTRPPPVPDEGRWAGRAAEPEDGRDALPVDGREAAPEDGRDEDPLDGREAPEGRE